MEIDEKLIGLENVEEDDVNIENPLKTNFSIEDFLASEDLSFTDFNLDEIVPEKENLTKGGREFDTDTSLYSKAFLAKLKETELIQNYDFGEESSALDQKKIIELANMALPIEFDDEVNELYFRDIDGNKHYIIFSKEDENNTFNRKAIAQLLPEVAFDITQSGILERSREDEAIYKVFVINAAFGGMYKDRIKRIFQQYDGKKLKGINESFTDLLTIIEQNSTSVVRILVFACNIKLSEAKTKKEAKLYSSLSTQEERELRKVKLSIATRRLQGEKIIAAKETKAEREVARQSLQRECDEIVAKSKISIIYKIFAMNSEDIPTKHYTQICELADDLAESIRLREDLESYDSIYNNIKRKIKQKGFREYVVEMKQSLLSDYYAGKTVNFGVSF